MLAIVPCKTIKILENASVDVLTWFKNNGMKANTDKCHLLVNSKEKVYTKIGPYNIESIEQQKLLEVFIDNKLTFGKNINNLVPRLAKNVMRYVKCHRS